MIHEIDLQKHVTVSNSGVVYNDTDSVQADFGIRIISWGEQGPFDFMLFGPMIKVPDLIQQGISKRHPNEMFGLAEECRKAWKSTVVDRLGQIEVDGKAIYASLFQEKWDFQKDTTTFPAIIPRLARAGEDLFSSIFEVNCDDGLKEIGQTIRKLMSSGGRSVAITSDKLFEPWGMLYTHPEGKLKGDGSNWMKEGFWGYQHIVQQTPTNYILENGIQPDADGAIPASVNFDDRLALQMKLPVIDKHIEYLRGLGVTITRTKKSELEVVFKQRRRELERIIYFYCHGHGSGGGVSVGVPYLQMTDDSVSSFDFQLWANGEKLPTSPLVFINACEGGQMTTMFYQSFAVELLKEGAVGLVGAQIDVPAVFGVEYAGEIFAKFFARTNAQRVRLGPLIREVNRKLWDTNHNPLGLVYSLYRGVDCFVDWQTAALAGAVASPNPENASSC